MFQNRPIIGKHLLCDIIDVQKEFTFREVMDLMEYICDEYNFNILQQIYHNFDDKKAFTIIFLLAESHFSIHTYPERKTISLDLYTCREYQNDTEYYEIIDILRDYFDGIPNFKIVNREF